MTEAQYNTAAELGLTLEGAAGRTESADFDDCTLAKESTDQTEQSEGIS